MGLWDAIRDVLDVFSVFGRRRLRVVLDTPAHCLIQGDRRLVSLDLRTRICDAGRGQRLPFAQFRAVIIRRREDDDGHLSWTVGLLTQHRGCLNVGGSRDDAAASIVAARLAGHLGCPVQTA